jgi:nicotinate-nucleotide--dimethylbenzimidazole phosphoribosyltransferase
VEEFKSLIEKIEPLSQEKMEEAQNRLDLLTKPQGSLGRLEEIAKKVVGITHNLKPGYKNKVIVTMVGDHGVVEEGVSAYPQEVTHQMVHNFIRGGAGINVLARHIGAKVVVVDMGVKGELKIWAKNFIDKKIDEGTKNFTKGPAMTRGQAVKAITAGMEVIKELDEVDILGIGDMGIGNTTSSSAIIACISRRSVEEVTGRGTGIDDATFKRKVQAIEKALSINNPQPQDPIDVLAKVGGFEIAGLAGCVLQAGIDKIPVVIDGFIATAGALIATELAPVVKDYIIASHNSQEVGHKVMLDRMGLNPLLDLNLRLGEGTGAALGISIVEASIKILTQMATFVEAGVSEKK